jgi:hypothetical protein
LDVRYCMTPVYWHVGDTRDLGQSEGIIREAAPGPSQAEQSGDVTRGGLARKAGYLMRVDLVTITV